MLFRSLGLLVTDAAAQYEESDIDALFVPDELVPLSEYVILPSSGSTRTVTLHVRRGIQQYATTQSAPVQIAVQATTEDRQTGSYSLYAKVGNTNSTVTFDVPAGAEARVVAVSSVLLNEFPIVTHWSSAENDDRGGFSEGATDGLGSIECGTNSGDPETYGVNHGTGGSVTSDDPDHVDTSQTPPPAFPSLYRYHFATDLYALFSDGSEASTDIEWENVPAYERYIGENWSGVSVSTLAAVRLSDLSRTWTNRPIAHRNPSTDFASVEPGLPILQIVHNVIGKYDDLDAEHPGREDCLASFVVPPEWESTPSEGYPVLLSAVYDVNTSMFTLFDNGWIRTIGELANENRSAVAIATNGGGNACSLSQQESIYINHRIVFVMAEADLGVDRERVVVLGGSRAATAALALSASPDVDPAPFTPRYVLAGVPTTYAGDGFTNHVNPTFGLIQEAVKSFTGYRHAWLNGFTVGGKTGGEMAAETVYGVPLADVDDLRSNAAPDFMEALAEKPCVVLLGGTMHDIAQPFSHIAKYYAELAPLLPERLFFSLAYRAGHGGYYVDLDAPSLMDAMRATIDNDSLPVFADEITHVHPVDDDAELAWEGTVFEPDPLPMVLEAPFAVGLGQPHTYVVTGPPGTPYIVYFERPGQTFDYIPAEIAFSGVLPASATAPFTSNTHHETVPVDNDLLGFWEFRLAYVDENSVGHVTHMQPSLPPAPLGDDDYNAVPTVYIGAGPVIGTTAFGRTGGIATDIVEDL